MAREDLEAFARLYNRHVNAVYRYVYFRVGDATFAEDLTGQAFDRAWKRFDRFPRGGFPGSTLSFEHWVIRIAREVVVDHSHRDHSDGRPL
jgi:RNA polymerase sigma-70 factor (ECF subfamily)